MITFTELISASIEWTGTLLFRPFNPKKWLILTFIALLAGTLTGGCNLNLPGRNEPKKESSYVNSQKSPADSTKVEKSQKEANLPPKSTLNTKALVIIIIIGVILIIGLIVLLQWLHSRFCFVFLENIVKNDASLKIPFRENVSLGNSLFLFQFFYGIIFLGVFLLLAGAWVGILFAMHVFTNPQAAGYPKIFLASLPFVLILGALFILALLIYLVVSDFIIVVMYKDKIKFMQALPKTMDIARAHKKELMLYILIKIGLAICSGIISSLLSLAVILGLLLPLGIISGLCYLIYLAVPQALHFLYFVVLALIGLPVALCVIYLMHCVNLPFAVFFRTFSLKFFGRISPAYNLFRYQIGEEAA